MGGGSGQHGGCRAGRGLRGVLAAVLLATTLIAVGPGSVPDAAAVDQEPRTTRTVKDGVTTYRITNGFDLDQYLYRASNPLDFAFDINPYSSLRTYQSGFPTPTHPLYNKQMLLTVFALDVDEEQGEVDEVWFNGNRLGTLSGVDGQWSVNTFTVPGAWVKFGPTGSATVRNNVEVKIDVAAQGWAVEVAWGELKLDPGPEPVLMAHGLNGASDSNDDGFNDGWADARDRYEYWLPELADRIAAPPMTDKGGVQTDMPILKAAADKLRRDTGFPNVNILAHSFGGLTARRYAFDGADALGRVKSLVMVATPNGGSEAATDLCKAQRADGLGRLNPRRWVDITGNVRARAGHCDDESSKLYQLQQWYVQDTFNEMVRDAGSQYPDRTTTDYYTIGGTNGSYTKALLNGQDDGNVELASVMYLRPENADVFGLGGNPDHPGRHQPWSVFNLGHSDLIKNDGPLDDALCLQYARLNAGPCPDADSDSTAASASASTTAMAASSEPAGADTDLVAAPSVDVAAGATATLDLATEAYPGASLALFSSGPLADLSATVDGQPLAAQDMLVATPLVGEVAGGAPGLVRVTNNGSATASVGVFVYATPIRDLTVALDQTRVAAGTPINVTVRLTGGPAGETPLASFVPADDGSDEASTDVALTSQGGGVFTGTFVAPAAGTYLVDSWFAGPELRTATASFAVADDDISLTGSLTESTVDEDGNGLYDGLLFDVGVDAGVAGSYRVVADVYGADGRKVDSAAGTATLTVGTGSIQVRAEGRQIYNVAADGPYRLKNVVLTRNDDAFTLEDLADDISGSTVYSYRVFEHDAVSIDNSSIQERTPEDTDGDGLYDAIVVTATVTVDTAGSHQLNARLTTPAGTSVSEWATTLNLAEGANTVTMRFPTNTIGTGSYDTVFDVRNFVAYRTDNTDAFDYVPEALTTRSYRSNEMEGFPLSPPSNARWSEDVTVSTEAGGATTTVSMQPQTTNADQIDVRWDASAVNTENPDTYNVELATDETFDSIVGARAVPATELTTTLTAADGFTAGRRYWFRVTARSSSGRDSKAARSVPLAVTDEDTGPVVAHAPVATAYQGQSIPVSMTATCRQGNPCAGRLFWRTTPIEAELGDRADAALGRGWNEVDLAATGAGAVNDRDAIIWSGTIPGWAVSTAGVDYYLEAEDQLAVTRVPGATFVGSDPVPDTSAPDLGYWHVQTVAPPVVTHVPPPFAPSDTSIPLSIDVACSTGDCQATMYYRTTTGPVTEEQVALRNGELVGTPNWPKVGMRQEAAATSLGQVGDVVRFTAQIPASFVDTRGVDYFFQVSDGATQAWAPGTSYQGYYAPNDGMRTAWYHVRVLETPRVIHAPPATTGYRQTTSISATANCPATRVCTARLYYRTTTSTVLDTTTPFASAPMTVVTTPGAGGLNIATATGVIPATAADTRGIDYFLSFSDGATTSWWPGTSSIDGYVPVAGIRVGYQHVRVLDPPHVSHTPVVAAPALRDLVIDASVTCATENCDVTLRYQKNLWAETSYPYSIPMTRVGAATDTPLGKLATYRATIPAADVTTTQLAYYIEAFDGYTRGYAPGTSYVGAYMPTDGTRVQSFPVRVLEPAHIAHVPPGAATAGTDLSLNATSNCATPSCTAVLYWRVTGQLAWSTVTMSGTRTGVGLFSNDTMSYSAVIPGSSVTTAGLEHWIEVNDGYVSERTPTWPTAVAQP